MTDSLHRLHPLEPRLARMETKIDHIEAQLGDMPGLRDRLTRVEEQSPSFAHLSETVHQNAADSQEAKALRHQTRWILGLMVATIPVAGSLGGLIAVIVQGYLGGAPIH
ncbi:hypothetical protein [Roseovarius salis]|uniref:hypothetical protein n=1 Tax=Roseovarius salis TaxID=3376063 RepID=UPI0037C834DC